MNIYKYICGILVIRLKPTCEILVITWYESLDWIFSRFVFHCCCCSFLFSPNALTIWKRWSKMTQTDRRFERFINKAEESWYKSSMYTIELSICLSWWRFYFELVGFSRFLVVLVRFQFGLWVTNTFLYVRRTGQFS